MNHLQVIERNGQRLLTTAQLAESYGTDSKRIQVNYNRNKARYEQGVHFFLLEGAELRDFKTSYQIDNSLKINKLYLWTEKGAWLHAKSLGSDEAWAAYNMLIESYYAAIEKLDNAQSPVAISHEQYLQIEERVRELESLVRQATLHTGEQKRLRNAVAVRVSELAKNQKDARPVLFRALYYAIKERYNVDSYRDVQQHKLQDCLRFVELWKG